MDKYLAKISTVLVKNWWLAVGAAVFVSFLLALTIGMGQSVWFDEGYSIMLAQRPLAELVALTQVDAHPPLYYLYLKLWGGLFGWSELALRLSSIIPGAAAVAVVALVARRLFDARVALAVLPFVVFAPLLVRYNFEIRMYGLIVLMTVVATYVLLRARASGGARWWLGYALLVTLAMYTLYMSVLVWLAHACWLVAADMREKKNPVLQRHWLFLLLAVAAFLPWVPSLLYQLENSALPPSVRGADWLSTVNMASLVMTYTPSWRSSGLLLGLVGVTFGLLFWLLFRAWKTGSERVRTAIMLPVIGFFGIALIYISLAVLTHSVALTERYLVPIVPFLALAFGAAVVLGYRAGEHWRAAVLGIAALGLFGVGLSTLATSGNYNLQRLQPVYADTIRASTDCHDTTVVTSGAYGFVDMWYAFAGCDFRYYQPAELTYAGGYAPLNALATTKRVSSSQQLTARTVLFIYYDDSTEFIEMDDRYHLTEQRNYTGLHVRVYQRDL